MLSTLNQPEQDPHDVIEIAPDVVLAARADKPSPTPATGAVSGASAPEVRVAPAPGISTPSVDTTFRATTLDDSASPASDRRSPNGRCAASGFRVRDLQRLRCGRLAALRRSSTADAGGLDATADQPHLPVLVGQANRPEQPTTPAVTAAAADQASAQTASAQPAPTAPPAARGCRSVDGCRSLTRHAIDAVDGPRHHGDEPANCRSEDQHRPAKDAPGADVA